MSLPPVGAAARRPPCADLEQTREELRRPARSHEELGRAQSDLNARVLTFTERLAAAGSGPGSQPDAECDVRLNGEPATPLPPGCVVVLAPIASCVG